MFFTSRFLPSRRPIVSQALLPCSRSSVAFDAAVEHAVDRDAVLQPGQRLFVDLAVDAHAVAPEPAGRRQFEHARQAAIIGQQQQAFGVDVEPADRHQPRQVRRQHVEHGLPALRIAIGGHHAGRLVEQEQPRPLDRRDLDAVELDRVVGA